MLVLSEPNTVLEKYSRNFAAFGEETETMRLYSDWRYAEDRSFSSPDPGMRQIHLTVLCLHKVNTVKQNRPFLTHALAYFKVDPFLTHAKGCYDKTYDNQKKLWGTSTASSKQRVNVLSMRETEENTKGRRGSYPPFENHIMQKGQPQQRVWQLIDSLTHHIGLYSNALSKQHDQILSTRWDQEDSYEQFSPTPSFEI